LHSVWQRFFVFKGTQASMPARDNFLKALPATAEGCVPIAIRIQLATVFLCGVLIAYMGSIQIFFGRFINGQNAKKTF